MSAKRQRKGLASFQEKSLTSIFWNYLNKFYPSLIIFFVIGVFFYPVIFQNKTPLPGDLTLGTYYPWFDYKWGFPVSVPVKNPITSDAISLIYPLRIAAINLMKSGQWPLWDSYLLGGVPLLADFQSAPFSPTNIFYFLFDSVMAWSLQIIIQHIFAAFFAYILLRYWKLSRTASTIGGLAYAFSGNNIIMSQWNLHVLVAAFIPLAIFCTDKWFKEQKHWSAILLSFTIAGAFFAGYPQVLLYLLLSIGLLILFNFQFTRQYFYKNIVLGIFIGLGIALTALQLLPAYELIFQSQRNIETIPFQWKYYGLHDLITFFAPDYYGNHATQNYWGFKNYMSNLGFMSTAGFILASLGLWYCKKNREVKFLLLLIIAALLMSFPTPLSLFFSNTGLLGSKAMVSYRILVLFCFAISCLIAYGVDYWILNKGNIKFSVFFVLPAFIISTFWVIAFFHPPHLSLSNDLENYHVALRNLILPIVSLCSLFIIFVGVRRWKKFLVPGVIASSLLIAVELFYFGWKFTPFVDSKLIFPTTPVIDFLISQETPHRINSYDFVFPANMNIPYNLEFASGYEPVYPVSMAQYIGVLNSKDPEVSPQDRFGTINMINSNLNDIFNIKYLLVKTSTANLILKEPKNSNLKPVFADKSTTILENENSLSRAYLVHDFEVTNKKEEIFTKLLDPQYPVSKKIILESNPQFVTPKQIKDSDTVQFLLYSPQQSKLHVTSSEDGLLFISNTWYPGWKAYVDGTETNILKANYVFQAIEVSSGSHLVELKYEPESFYLGLKISLLALTTLLLLPIFPIILKKLYD